MILHVVLFKPKPNFDEDARRGLARAFADAIDGINSSRKHGLVADAQYDHEQLMRVDYTHAAILEFDDLDGYTSRIPCTPN